jgi:hypothetical protein
MTLNHIFSLMTFAIGALCFVAFITTLKPPQYHSLYHSKPTLFARATLRAFPLGTGKLEAVDGRVVG